MFSFLLTCSCLVAAIVGNTITTVEKLASALQTLPATALPATTSSFCITGKVCCIVNCIEDTDYILIADSTGNSYIRGKQSSYDSPPTTGDIICASGETVMSYAPYAPLPVFKKVTSISHDKPISPIKVHFKDILCGKFDWHLLRVSGLVRDVLQSETCPGWAILCLCSESNSLRVHIPLTKTKFNDLTNLIGCNIDAIGFPNTNGGSQRTFAGREFHCPGISHIRVLDSTYPDPFKAPMIETLFAKSSIQISTSGRVQTSGLVLCNWNDSNALLKNAYGDIVCISCDNAPIPSQGQFIKVSGFPQSDSFHITLTHAIFQKCEPVKISSPDIVEISPENMLHDKQGRTRVYPQWHGRRIRICGVVYSLPDNDKNDNTILLENNNYIFPVTVSTKDKLPTAIELGCNLSVCGTCIMEAEYWRPGLLFPQIKNFSVVVNNITDIAVTEYPPWWTAKKLLIIIGTLLALFVGVQIRHRLQKKHAAFLAKTMINLKVEERTRLAVELHDAISQNLTGVALEINAATKTADVNPTNSQKHLAIAARTLKSCREELKNCLWDLRNNALEEGDMEEAIRRTLQPQIGTTTLIIRFKIPRSCLSDNTTHAILRILRELSVNAIRHGNANKIKIAGSIDNGQLLFSVTDNGIGFDPSHRCGMYQGHFGLQGIQERVENFDGNMNICSSPGNGTKVIITLNLNDRNT